MLKHISFHPKFAGVIDLLSGLIFLWWLGHIPVWWVLLIWFFARLICWAVVIRLVYYPTNLKRFWHLISLLVFHLGSLLLLLFIDWSIAWNLVGAIYLIFPLVSFWLLPAKTSNESLPFVMKPYRRWRFWMSTFGLYGVWSATFAAISLQIFNLSYWFLLLAATIFTTILTYWWWKEYQIENNTKLWLWTICKTIFIFEISWVLFHWPLGYFTNAFVLIWLWYDIWLLARFHLLPAGINWRKQILFFIINGVLLVTYLGFIVKWK